MRRGLEILFALQMEQERIGQAFRKLADRTVKDLDRLVVALAGDIDPNGYLKLMHSTTEKLIDGAETAAASAARAISENSGDGVAILVSCIGRKLVMGDRVDEEVEAVAELMGHHTTVTGFYSNGEIAGSAFNNDCRLHNQTMTITWMAEA